MLNGFARAVRRILKWLRKPAVLRGVKTVGERNPRLPDSRQDNAILTFIGTDSAILKDLQRQADRLFRGFQPGDRVLIKINHNTADTYPASTDQVFLIWILDMLAERGLKGIRVGDCSAISHLPTRKVFEASGMYKALQSRAEVVCFDEGEWVRVPIHGTYLDHVTIPKCIYEADKIIYVANCKTHSLSGHSLGMKLAVGWMHPYERYALHRDHLCEKIAEIQLAVRPDLIFMDARKVFVTGGPSKGKTADGSTVFVGQDIMAMDAEGCKLLYGLKKSNGCLDGFPKDPYDTDQMKHAAKLAEEGRYG